MSVSIMYLLHIFYIYQRPVSSTGYYVILASVSHARTTFCIPLLLASVHEWRGMARTSRRLLTLCTIFVLCFGVALQLCPHKCIYLSLTQHTHTRGRYICIHRLFLFFMSYNTCCKFIHDTGFKSNHMSSYICEITARQAEICTPIISKCSLALVPQPAFPVCHGVRRNGVLAYLPTCCSYKHFLVSPSVSQSTSCRSYPSLSCDTV